MRSHQPFCTWCNGTARTDPPRELTRILHRRKDNYRESSLGLLWEADGSKGRRLTVKLRGHPEAPDGAEGAQFLSARGAKPQAHHGPLQRLLDGMAMTSTDSQNRGITLSDPQGKVVRQSGTEFGHILGPFLNSEGDPPDIALIKDYGR